MIGHLKDGGTLMLVQRYEYNRSFSASEAISERISNQPNTLFEAMKEYSVLVEPNVVYASKVINVEEVKKKNV